MGVTNGSGYFPFAIFFLPDVHKSERPAFIFTILHVAKPVCAYFDCAVILDGINLETVSEKLPCHVVPLCKHDFEISHRLCVSDEPFVILIKLEVSDFSFFTSRLLKAADNTSSKCFISPYNCWLGAAAGESSDVLATAINPTK